MWLNELNSPNLIRKWCSPYSYSSLHFFQNGTIISQLFNLLQKNFHAWVFFSILLSVHLKPKNKKVTVLTYGENYCPSLQLNGWSEPAATSAWVQDEAVQAVLRMSWKHIFFPCLGIFQPFFGLKIFPSYLPLPSPTSFPAHSIANFRESSQAWVAQSLKETWDTRLEEGEEFNVEGMWRAERQEKHFIPNIKAGEER